MNSLEFIDFFKAQLTDDTSELTLDTNFRALPDWDSLTAMLLITNLKDEHGIEFNISELQSCKTIGEIFNIISAK